VEDVPNNGLGPRFNLDSCAGSHAHPAAGGSSPAINRSPGPDHGPTARQQDSVVSFADRSGSRGALCERPDGSPDGGVHDLFVITRRSDAPTGCKIQQPDFAGELAKHNVIFRIPTPVCGNGLLEAISEITLRQNLASDPGKKAYFGITGRPNTNGNDGSVTRFWWKAQHKSLEIFAGETYNVEMGVTSEVFPDEREENPDCSKVATPITDLTFNPGGNIVSPDFRGFMRFPAPPTPATTPRPTTWWRLSRT
jgi:hypothetical protein